MSSDASSSCSRMGSSGICEWAIHLFARRCRFVLPLGIVMGGWLIGRETMGQRSQMVGFHRIGKLDSCPGEIGNSKRSLDVIVCEKVR